MAKRNIVPKLQLPGLTVGQTVTVKHNLLHMFAGQQMQLCNIAWRNMPGLPTYPIVCLQTGNMHCGTWLPIDNIVGW